MKAEGQPQDAAPKWRTMGALRNRSVVLSLVLKGKWYDMIERGEKLAEYRLPTPYWRTRFSNWNWRYCEGRRLGAIDWPNKIVEFRRGYAADAPRMAFSVRQVARVRGVVCHADWGEPEGERLKIELHSRVKWIEEEKAENGQTVNPSNGQTEGRQ